MAEWMSFPMYYAFDGAAPPPRAGASHATIYPYGPFAAGDGKSVMLGLQNEREWAVFCDKVLMQPALAQDSRFDANAKRSAARPALHALIETAFAKLTAKQVIERLEAAGIANAQVNTMADLWAHAQLAARARWVEVQTPAGAVPALLPPGATDASQVRMDAVPAVGQHSVAILHELGLSPAQIEQLKAEAAI
jgi:itaconate CoA-transferase